MKARIRLTADSEALAWGARWQCVGADGRVGFGRTPWEAFWNKDTPT